MTNGISVVFGRFGWLMSLLLSAVVLLFMAVLPQFAAPPVFAGFLLLSYCARLSFAAIKTAMQRLE